MNAPSLHSVSSSADSLRTSILPASYYYDQAAYAREQELLFGGSWIHVGHASRIPNPGDYMTCEIGGQSIILLRAKSGAIGAFYNVCRHRATQLLQGEGNVAGVFCRYHGWTYDLQGRLIVARNSENVPGFDKSCWGLRSVRLERIAGFLFVCLDSDTPSMAEIYEGLADDLLHMEPEIERLVHAHSMTFDIACNWKIAVENFLEAYHVRSTHPEMYKAFDMKAYVWQMNDFYTSLNTVAKLNQGVEIYDWNESERTDMPGYWVWPMTMFERMPGRVGLFTYNHIPMGPERTLNVVDFYFLDAELTDEDRKEIAYVDLIRRQDVVNLEAVQRGIRSNGWGKGPYMVGPDSPAECTEAGLMHLHQIVEQCHEPGGARLAQQRVINQRKQEKVANS